MEYLLVLALTAILFIVALGWTVWLWLGLFLIASFLGYRAYRVRCRNCGEKTITGRGMKFCNQCGAKQTSQRWLRMRCESCRGMARSELNMNFCNRCGTPLKSETPA